MTMCRQAGVDGGSSMISRSGTHGESLELKISYSTHLHPIHLIAYAPRIGHTSKLTANIFNGSLLNKRKMQVIGVKFWAVYVQILILIDVLFI